MASVLDNVSLLNPYMAQLQSMYGSFDPQNVQLRRRSYYSFLAYPTAGQTAFQFFATAIGASNRQLTNIQRSGHLDNPFILKALRCRYFITGAGISQWVGTDATTIFGDIVNGFANAGVLRLTISSKEWFQLPNPFQLAPFANGIPETYTNGGFSAAIGPAPAAFPGGAAFEGATFLLDPEFLIGSDQTFMCSIEYPSGAVPVIGSTIISTNTTLFIGVDFDGIEIRPLQ